MHQLEYELKNTALKYIIFQFFEVAVIDYYITFNFQPPAPEELLTIIRCKCKNCTRNQCGTNICSCKRNGLSCLAACGECRGVCCYNSATVEDEEVKENEREMDERNLYDTLFT